MCLGRGFSQFRYRPPTPEELAKQKAQAEAAKARAAALARLDGDLQAQVNQAGRVMGGSAVKGTSLTGPGYIISAQDAALAEQKKRDDLRSLNDQLAKEQQAEVDRITEAQRQAELQQEAELQRQAELQQQVNQARVAQEERIGRQRLATQAVSQSMEVLSNRSTVATAPTAAVSRKPSSGRRRVASSSGELRIGSASQAPGAGLNIGG